MSSTSPVSYVHRYQKEMQNSIIYLIWKDTGRHFAIIKSVWSAQLLYRIALLYFGLSLCEILEWNLGPKALKHCEKIKKKNSLCLFSKIEPLNQLFFTEMAADRKTWKSEHSSEKKKEKRMCWQERCPIVNRMWMCQTKLNSTSQQLVPFHNTEHPQISVSFQKMILVAKIIFSEGSLGQSEAYTTQQFLILWRCPCKHSPPGKTGCFWSLSSIPSLLTMAIRKTQYRIVP